VRPSPTWEARENASVAVLTALYVRDALGVVDPGGMPRLRGTGLPDLEAPDMRTGWAWTRWWIQTVEEDGPGFPLLLSDEDDGAGRRLGRHLDSARLWAGVAHRTYAENVAAGRWADATIGQVVAAREALLGRRARPFRLRVEVLPLAEQGLWWIGENAIAVDEAIRDEPLLFADALGPVIDQLV
jgi:hypothetical protein